MLRNGDSKHDCVCTNLHNPPWTKIIFWLQSAKSYSVGWVNKVNQKKSFNLPLWMNISLHVWATDIDDPVPYPYTMWALLFTKLYLRSVYLPNTLSRTASAGLKVVPLVSVAIHVYTPACSSCTGFLLRDRLDSVPVFTVTPSWRHSIRETATLSLHVIEGRKIKRKH